MAPVELTQDELGRVGDAFILAINAHNGTFRGKGVPYVSHPIRVALHALSLGLSSDAVIAAVLHDVVEDTAVPLPDITERFGTYVSSLVKALTKPPSGFKDRSKVYQEQLLSGPEEARQIKLLDIQDNLSDVEAFLEEGAARAYRESRESLAKALRDSLESS